MTLQTNRFTAEQRAELARRMKKVVPPVPMPVLRPEVSPISKPPQKYDPVVASTSATRYSGGCGAPCGGSSDYTAGGGGYT